MTPISRRQLLAGSSAMLAAGLGQPVSAAPKQEVDVPADFAKQIRFALNTATIREPRRSLAEVVDIAAGAGYTAIEPWLDEIDRCVEHGGSLADERKRIADHGMTVESAIAFPEWIVDDPARRDHALEEARRAMERVRAIGGTRIAAPPAGARDIVLDPHVVAERYCALLKIGAEQGVVPQLEIWSQSQTLQKLPEAAYVLLLADHPQACLLPDVYHLYRGGSGFHGLSYISGAAMHVIHMNDYPAMPPRDKLTDADRVYPGDGVAPLDEIVRSLAAGGFRGTLSLELFNRDYWKQDPRLVARTGLEKMKKMVARAFAHSDKSGG